VASKYNVCKFECYTAEQIISGNCKITYKYKTYYIVAKTSGYFYSILENLKTYAN